MTRLLNARGEAPRSENKEVALRQELEDAKVRRAKKAREFLKLPGGLSTLSRLFRTSLA